MLSLCAPLPAPADPRPPDAMSAGELRQALRRLQVTGSVLYVGAHPDDDNTSLLAWLARHRLVRTAYLSLTRGDGGQNILGPEQGDALGVLRTQELLASRRVDGAEQFFGRELDFGFSKSPDEALAFWGHDRALADVVWVIRRFRPDVIITRFGTDGSGGHGHHTASAILAGEAFRAAADSTKFPEQLRWVRPWQARRLLWNTFGGSPAADKLPKLAVETGDYDPELGLSYAEIGGRARSLNRSQGAGTRERRGSITEAFRLVDGEPATHDLLDGVTLDWSRVPGADGLARDLAAAGRAFDPDHPWTILPALARAHHALGALGDDPLVEAKRRELEAVMRSCAGLWLDALAETPTVTPGDSLRVTLTAIARAPAGAMLAGIALPYGAHAYFASQAPAPSSSSAQPPAAPRPDVSAPADSARRALAALEPVLAMATIIVPDDAPYTQPYWLRQPPRRGGFEVDDAREIGDAENRPALVARVTVALAGEPVTFDVPIAYKWTDRVYGDRYRDLEILPAVTLQLDHGVYLFSDARGDARPREVRLAVRSTRAAFQGVARLRLPAGFTATPARAPVHLAAGAEQVVRFEVRAGGSVEAATLGGEVDAGDAAMSHADGDDTARLASLAPGRDPAAARGRYTSGLLRIDYPHVPIQTLLPPCEARVVHADVRVRPMAVGYLMGTGDDVPEALAQLGCHVTLLSDDDVENGNLSQFGCIVAGIRAYNTRPRLRVLQPRLLDYVNNGGRLVVQYNQNEAALKDVLGPWPLTLSGARVSVEDAPMRVLKPDDPVLRVPNAIGAHDFDGWVQERGTYYADPFDARYRAPLSANDPGEPARDGGLLVTAYGKGTFAYTALAFFRQLPAGVPGAWRLFANLVSAAR